MPEEPFSNREIRQFHEEIYKELSVIGKELTIIKAEVQFTNGKVRKIIIAVISLSFFSLGLGFNQVLPIIGLLL